MLLACFTNHLLEAGLDEAGRGCLAGPVVAAAVILPRDFQHPVLNDSKQMTVKQRLSVRKDIERDAIAWAIGEASHQEIDSINILKASFLAMHRAVEQLSHVPELLLVDGNRFTPYPFVSHQCIVKGDSKYASIAAASVLAKTYRDEAMEQLAAAFPGYGWERNAGYPTTEHRKAIYSKGLTPHHRLTFKIDQLEFADE